MENRIICIQVNEKLFREVTILALKESKTPSEFIKELVEGFLTYSSQFPLKINSTSIET